MDDRLRLILMGADQKQADAQTRLPGSVSLWLYIAGLCVTLAGLFAVNFSLEDPNFATLTYALAIVGYGFSYFVRVRRVDLNAIKMPLFISVALLVLAYVSGSGPGWLIPANVADNRPLGLQVLFAWVAIIHSFLLVNDASVLFACVPSMTMLALVSTTSPDQEVQNAFLVFVGASTFLMVHENYLRTRNAKTLRRGTATRPLFSGQLLLTAACLIGALIMANLVAVPIKTVGQSLFDASMTPMGDSVVRQRQTSTFAVSVNERNTLNLAQGPVTESDTQLLRVQASRGMYWRGTTFSNYTGNSFDNGQQAVEQITLEGQKQDASQAVRPGVFAPAFNSGAFTDKYVYRLPLNPYDLPASEMKDSHEEKQTIQVIGGYFSNLYGAGMVREVTAPIQGLKTNNAGTLLGSVPGGSFYNVVSQVATRDETKLQRSSARLEDVPRAIRDTYLQLPSEHPEDNERVRQLTEALTKSLTNNYDKAETLRKYIAEQCKYNLQVSAAPRDRDVVAWFLFDKKEGYCDSFAAAMTVLCRHAGIPARLVSGFLPGDIESDGMYVVREKHKHVWTEVFFPHYGWVPFDATEGSLDISDHSNGTKKPQSGFMKWLTTHGSLPVGLLAIMAGMLGYVIKVEVLDRLRMQRHAEAEMFNRPATNTQVIEAYVQTETLLRRRGLARMPHQTPDEFEKGVEQRFAVFLPKMSQNLAGLTHLYTLYRYGRGVATQEEVEQAKRLATTIREDIQAVKPREFAEMAKSGHGNSV